MHTTLVSVSKLKINTGQVDGLPANPRLIKNERFEKLVKSIKDDPEMMELREVIAYDNGGEYVVIAGNMRLKACEQLGIKEIPTKILAHETPIEKLKAYAIKDNVSFGEHDWELLQADWDVTELEGWGLDIREFPSEESRYTTAVKSPVYEAKNEKPHVNSLFDLFKYEKLVERIDESGLDAETKVFLRLAAGRHIVFNYSKIADFYAHSEKPVQELMEESALVIIDFKRAIELGFVKLYEDLINLEDGEE